jgi:hypothetical protein
MLTARRTCYFFCVILSLLTCCALVAQNKDHRIPNIVLVHGAWADGSGWKGVYDILVKDGYNVSIVQEPETTFQDDVTATKRILALQDGPCILVGHSYGGAVTPKRGRTRRLLVWCTSPPTCQMLVRVRLKTVSASPATSASLTRSRERPTVSLISILRSFASTSQPTCLRRRLLSWRDPKCSTRL